MTAAPLPRICASVPSVEALSTTITSAPVASAASRHGTDLGLRVVGHDHDSGPAHVSISPTGCEKKVHTPVQIMRPAPNLALVLFQNPRQSAAVVQWAY